MSGKAAGDIVIYGIANCDSCRKARHWLDDHGVAYRAHDLRGDGLERRVLEAWLETLDWEQLLNRRSKTWRDLPASRRDGLDQGTASALMLTEPLLIKRPVLAIGPRLCVGFSVSEYASLFPR